MTREAMIVDRKTISIMKACELVGVSRRTIYNWIADGKGRVCPDGRRIDQDIRRYLVAQFGWNP